MSTVELPKSIPFQPVQLSVERYHALTKAGAFCEHDAVELLDGVVVEKMSKNPAHRLATRECDLLLYWLVNLVDRRIEVMTEPRVVGDLASYDCCKIVDSGDRLEFMVNGMVAGTLAVNDLLG